MDVLRAGIFIICIKHPLYKKTRSFKNSFLVQKGHFCWQSYNADWKWWSIIFFV